MDPSVIFCIDAQGQTSINIHGSVFRIITQIKTVKGYECECQLCLSEC